MLIKNKRKWWLESVAASYRGQTSSVRVRVSPVVSLVPSPIGEEPSGSARMEGENVLVLEKGGSANMALTAVLADGTRENVTSASEWVSENAGIVFSGWVRNWGLIIRGIAEGTSVVTASLEGLTTTIKQLNKALGLAFWQEQGLKSLVERYDTLRSTT